MATTPPQFHRPPVLETILGVEFAPLEKWGVPHYGLFWSDIRSEYRTYEVQKELAPSVDDPKDLAKRAGTVSIRFQREPIVRCWFHHATGQRLLQVQPDRFLHNWRKSDAAQEYPRYESIRPIFDAEWQRFRAFVAREELGEISVRTCEVTYINQVPQGEGWESLADLHRIFRTIGATSDRPLPPLDAVQFKTAYLLPDKMGKIHVDISHAIRNADLSEVLQFTISVRGRPAGARMDGVGAWMDNGHRWALDTFFAITSDEIRARWKERG